MRILLLSHWLWDIVENDYFKFVVGQQLTLVEIKKLEEDHMKNARALFFMEQSVVGSFFFWIIGATKSEEVWDIL